jgi:hypothetical protein
MHTNLKMAAVAVPKKMIPMSKVMGVEAFKEIKPEMVALKPVAHGNTVYKQGGVNKISFRIPSFSNALLDTSRSFLSMVVGANTGAVRPTVNTNNADIGENQYLPGAGVISKGLGLISGAPVFTRIVIKSSAGLTLEDIDQLDVLDQLFELHEDTSDANNSLIYGKSMVEQLSVPTQNQNRVMGFNEASVRGLNIANADLDTPSSWRQMRMLDFLGGIEVLYKFNIGILSKRLAKYLPLFMADGGAGYTFDIDLYVNGSRALEQMGAVATPKKELLVHSPVYNMCLLRMDEGLSRRFNQIATSGAEIRIPFNTYHTHLASCDQQNMTINIHENATNFKKIWTCLTGLGDTDCYKFHGGVRSIAPVIYYNYRLGTTFVYNEPVQEQNSNFRTVQHVKNALGVSDNYTMLSETPFKFQTATVGDAYGERTAGVLHEFNAFHMVASFDYAPEERLMIQGVSSSNPVELHLKFLQAPLSGTMAVNFAELSYDLVFRNGIVTYEEQKPGSQSVY